MSKLDETEKEIVALTTTILATLEKANKRLYIATLALTFCLFATIMIFILTLHQYNFEVYDIYTEEPVTEVEGGEK